jgi:hypothetical protein
MPAKMESIRPGEIARVGVAKGTGFAKVGFAKETPCVSANPRLRRLLPMGMTVEDLALEVPGDDAAEADVPPAHDDAEPFAGRDEPVFEEQDGFAPERDERHPLLERATDLVAHLYRVFGDAEPRFEASLRTLFQGSGDVVGGLAQALSSHGGDEYDFDDYGLRVIQFKRALRGAAFARGALFLLRPTLTGETFHELYGALTQLEKDVFHELGRVRSEYRANEE